jgi:hypothetical protein
VRLHPSGSSSITRKEIETLIAGDKGGDRLRLVLDDRQIPCLHPDHPLTWP